MMIWARKHSTRTDAEAAMDKVLDPIEIGNLDPDGWRRVRSRSMSEALRLLTQTVPHQCP